MRAELSRSRRSPRGPTREARTPPVADGRRNILPGFDGAGDFSPGAHQHSAFLFARIRCRGFLPVSVQTEEKLARTSRRRVPISANSYTANNRHRLRESPPGKTSEFS